MTPIPFRRGDVWQVDFVPARGHEQDGVRPAAIVSVDLFSNGPADLVAVLPITKRDRGIAVHVRVAPPEGGLSLPSVIQCDQVVTVSRGRMLKRLGSLTPETMREVNDRLSLILGLVPPSA